MGISSALSVGSAAPGVCTSTTRPTNPFEGQMIYETDTDRMLVWNGSSWRYTWFSSMPAFYARLTSSQNIAGSAVVVFSSVTVNSGSHYNASNGRFTAPVDGLYWFSTRLLTQNDTNVADIRFHKNGSMFLDYSGFSMVPTGGGTQHRQVHIQGVMSLAANDYVTVNANAGGGIVLYGNSGDGHTAFSGYWLGN